MDCVIASRCHGFENFPSELAKNRWARDNFILIWTHTIQCRIDRVADRPGNMRSTFDSHSNVNVNFHFIFVQCECVCVVVVLIVDYFHWNARWFSIGWGYTIVGTTLRLKTILNAIQQQFGQTQALSGLLKFSTKSGGIRMKQPQNKNKTKNEKDKLIIRKIAVSCVRTW